MGKYSALLVNLFFPRPCSISALTLAWHSRMVFCIFNVLTCTYHTQIFPHHLSHPVKPASFTRQVVTRNDTRPGHICASYYDLYLFFWIRHASRAKYGTGRALYELPYLISWRIDIRSQERCFLFHPLLRLSTPYPQAFSYYENGHRTVSFYQRAMWTTRSKPANWRWMTSPLYFSWRIILDISSVLSESECPLTLLAARTNVRCEG